MRKISILFYISIILLASYVLLSCNTSKDDDSFRIINGGVYIIQTNIGGSPSFLPYVYFQTSGGTLRDGSVMHGSDVLDGISYVTNFYETTLRNSYNSLTDINGRYTLMAVSTEGEDFVASLNFNLSTEPLGDIVVPEFFYENGKITARIDNVENANYYGFFINPEVDEVSSFSRIYGYIRQFNPNPNLESQTITFDFPSGQMQYRSVRITPVAFFNTNNATLLIEGPEKTLVRGSTSFN